MILPTAVVPPPEYVPMDRFGALAQTSASIPLLLVILIELWKVCCSMFFRTFESCICISRTALLIVCSLFISCTSLEILNTPEKIKKHIDLIPYTSYIQSEIKQALHPYPRSVNNRR
eukprot:TRINITY_DN1089_c0_g1_i22.p1 TRINITY_DN1089_c0_g1~~TRINITY_DN1089_c0_g1_i22.p1  ORF type:complete len:117 (-),score=4.83 TRINITY_DN1089_c0_g1_i22:259-609(-)